MFASPRCRESPIFNEKQFLGKITSVPGFSFTRNLKICFRNARKLLQKVNLSKRKDLVVWHDLTNNTISHHRSNNYQPCSVPELTPFLRTNKDRFSAIVYCRRIGSEDIFQELLKSELLVLSVTKHLISRERGRRSQEIIPSCIRKLRWRLGPWRQYYAISTI